MWQTAHLSSHLISQLSLAPSFPLTNMYLVEMHPKSQSAIISFPALIFPEHKQLALHSSQVEAVISYLYTNLFMLDVK